MKRLRKSQVGILFLLLLLASFAIKWQVFANSANIYDQIQRFIQVVQVVQRYYVEDVDPEKLVTGAINGMLGELDPHTVYISSERLKDINEEFEGAFEGIGVEFVLQNKIPTVIAPIPDTPSEKLGIRPGDQIVKIEGHSTYGASEDEIMIQLRGPKNSQVVITIKRPGQKEAIELRITRDSIPLYSITTYFMIDKSTGYIRIGKFSKTTNEEFENALEELESKGLKQLIVDLRDNSGGYLEQAVEIADKFLDGGKRIVYTRGRTENSNEDYYATTEATHPTMPLIVLINHGSASASEILAGAMQDWDRGLIVGETSFGKGLVQNQIELKDGSAIRVTVARYYTPSGRLIQRSYENGIKDYLAQGFDDVDPNATPDSSLHQPSFTTSSGRKVYGGGGITPDIIVPSEKTNLSTAKLIQSQVFLEYGSNFATRHKELSRDFEFFREQFRITDGLLRDFKKLARTKKIAVDEASIDSDLAFIKRRLKSQIARSLWGAREYYQIEVSEDRQVRRALKLFSQAAKIAGLSLD
ncbi:MAG: S41 family peptidase [bacterium]